MEFRKYDKLNCTIFDLISGDLEPKQTMALGFLLAKSEVAMKCFLKLIRINIKYDRYIVDCEAQRKHPNNNGRIDILIRFYNKTNKLEALIIEAKSARAKTSAQKASIQANNYVNSFGQLNGFSKIRTVTLTREVKSITNSISISWSELISELFKVSSRNDIINDFLIFFLNIKGNMNFYEQEVLSIPAGKTYNAVMNTGIYECPISYNSRKRSLYITFRLSGKDKGKMEMLYKLTDVIELDVNDQSAINSVDYSLPGFKNRLANYKKMINISGMKRLYILDMSHPIKLPNPVRPIENNTPPIYYNLHDFFGQINSNINAVIAQKEDIEINQNVLKIKNFGKKSYTLCDNSGAVITSSPNGHILNMNQQYIIDVKGKNRNVQLKKIELRFKQNKWEFFFIF